MLPHGRKSPQHLLCPTQAGNQLAEVQPPTCFPIQAKELGRELHPAHHCLSKGQMRCSGRGCDGTRKEHYLPPTQADFFQGTFSKLTAASQTPELLVLLKRSPCSARPCRRAQEGWRISAAQSLQTRLAARCAHAGSQVTPTAGSFQMSSFISAAIASGSLSPCGLLGQKISSRFARGPTKWSSVSSHCSLRSLQQLFMYATATSSPLHPQTQLTLPDWAGD